MKRWLSLLLAALILLTSACFAEGAITVFREGQGMPDPEDDAILPGIKKAMGCDVEWTVVSAEYATQLNVRLAGDNIPNLFQVDYNMAPTYIRQGLLLNIEPYLDKMPNFVANYSESALENCYMNGGMYLIAARPYIAYADYSIRQDWLDNLGLKMPQTLDELYDVLYAFTYTDPDGNQKDDTYGLTGRGLSAFNIVFRAFGTTQPGSFLIENGSVVYSSTDPDMKSAIEFIQKLIDAGVVDPEVITNQSMEHRDKAISGYAGVLACTFWDIFKQTYMDQALAICPTAHWELLPGVEGPGGRWDVQYDSTNAPSYFGVDAELENDPEQLDKVLRLLDFLCTPETGHRLTLFGQEGVHYELDAEGNVVPLEKLSEITYSFNYTICGRDDLPYLKTKFGYLSRQIEQCGAMKCLPIYNSKTKVPDEVNLSDIETYADEEITRFIYGERSLDEWDAYVETMNNVYGLSVYMESARNDLIRAGLIAE